VQGMNAKHLPDLIVEEVPECEPPGPDADQRPQRKSRT
jgi:hypothetical protein